MPDPSLIIRKDSATPDSAYVAVLTEICRLYREHLHKLNNKVDGALVANNQHQGAEINVDEGRDVAAVLVESMRNNGTPLHRVACMCAALAGSTLIHKLKKVWSDWKN